MSVVSNIKFYPVPAGSKQKSKVYFTIGNAVNISGTIVEGSNGLFVSLPRHKYTDKTTNEEKWADDVKWADKDTGNAIQNEILAAFKNGGTSPTAGTGAPAKTNGSGVTKTKPSGVPF